ncbi:hypothetical protein BG004_006630 [Podila humilis]|nr:hypothetical protein BG004_006630 [Podila humilis]
MPLRRSTIIYPTASLDGLVSPGPGLTSPSSSAFGQSLKPPSTTSSNRNSFGMWGGSKSAASTPNLSNLSSMSAMSQTNLPAALSPPAQGSAGQESEASATSSGSSFQQRRKRSESIGGIKSTAGNITRIVRKSSSNFLRKLVKTFDDKDAPPIPHIPSSKSAAPSFHNITPPSSLAGRTTAVPELPSLSAYGSGFGPLDAAPMSSLTSDINAQMGDNGLINSSRPVSMHPLDSSANTFASSSSASILRPNNQELDFELSKSVSNVESWLNNSALESASPSSMTTLPKLLHTTTRPEATTDTIGSLSSVSPLTSAALTGTTVSTAITSHSDISGRQRRDSECSGSTDDDDEEDEDGIPIAAHARGSNRISRLYETGSIHLGNQSQTSLYYSVKSTVSDEADNNAIAASKRASMAQDIVFNRSSIRFSEYGISSIKDLSTTPSSTISSDNACPDKPLPKRPTSMFVSMSTPTSMTTGNLAHDKQTGNGPPAVEERDNNSVNDISTSDSSAQTTPVSSRSRISGSSPTTGATLGANLALPLGGYSTGARPATICVSPDDAIKISQVSSTVSTLAADMSPAAQREATETLALRTSKRCYREDETFLPKDEISCYLGTPKPFNRMVLVFYMNNFDFSGKRLDFAFRSLCQKLVLKGETQEVDRVLEAFAQRYVDCNPQHLLGSKDIVHAITYSILLLNTDLHIVQQSTKMSRSAFVKNTLQTVQAQVHSADRPSDDLGSSHGLSLTRTGTGELSVNGSGGKKRTPSVKSWKSGQSHQSRSSKMGADPKANGGHGNGKYWMSELESLLKDIYSTVKSHQILLPTSTQSQTPSTPTSSSFGSHWTNTGSNNLLGGSNGFLPRMSRQVHPNALSEAGFGHLGNNDHGRIGGGSSGGINVIAPFGMARRNSNAASNARTRQLRQEAMHRLNAAGTIEGGTYLTPGSSSNSSHRYSVIGNIVGDGHTLGGASVSLLSHGDRHGASSSSRLSMMPPASGILHSHPSSMSLQSPTGSSFGIQEHEHLEQYHHGRNNNANQARYRMEGIMFRKHLLERSDKKAQHRNWRQLLVVLDQGGLSMFRADGQLGQAFEEQGILFDEIRLQHTITNILPPPGYSSSRRHVFAIQLYTGAVYLFQTTTAQEAEDWARTCNYWAARTSKEPLVGGVINMDYGWGRSLDVLNQSPSADSGIGHSNTMTSTSSGYSLSGEGINNSSGSSLTMPPPAVTSHNNSSSSSSMGSGGVPGAIEEESSSHGPPTSSGSTPTFLNYPHTSSGSSSTSNYGHGGVSGGGRTASIKSTTKSLGGGGGSNVPLGDRVLLFDWSAPLPTMSMSQISEQDQVNSLKKFVSSLESEMEQHQEYRGPMTKLYLPKSQNYAKAFNNWERRSRYLLKEMVKYQIYVEALEQSLEIQRQEAQAEADEAAIATAQQELSQARAQPVVLPTVVGDMEESKSLNEELDHLQVDDEEEEEDEDDIRIRKGLETAASLLLYDLLHFSWQARRCPLSLPAVTEVIQS